jgi:hypothetical protein
MGIRSFVILSLTSSVALKPGQVYKNTISYCFSAQ